MPSNYIPVDRVLLTDDQLRELIGLVPDIPGIGNSARRLAKRNLLTRISRVINRLTIIRDQSPFVGLKKAIKEGNMAQINEEYKKLHEEMLTNKPSSLPEYRRISSLEDNFTEQMKRSMSLFYPQKPHLPAYEVLKGIFKRSFDSSFIEQGLDIGTLAGMALGQPISQMVLSAFHTTNESMDDSSEHFPRLQQLLNASQTNKFPHSYIAFCDPEQDYNHFEDVIHYGTFEDVYNRRRTMEEVNLDTLRSKIPHLVARNILERDGVLDLIETHNQLFPSNVIGDVEFGVELSLDPYMMYFYNLTMANIAKAVAISSGNHLQCVWSSQNIPGDPRTNKLWILPPSMGPTEERKFLDDNLLKNLDKFLVSGYIGIKKLLPVKENIVHAIDEIRESFNNPMTWVVRCDTHVTRRSSVSSADVEVMLRKIGFTRVQRPLKGSEIRLRFNPLNFSRFSVTSDQPDKVKEIKDLVSGVRRFKSDKYSWVLVPKNQEDPRILDKLQDAFSIFNVRRGKSALLLELKQDSLAMFVRYLVGSTSRYHEYGHFYSAVTQGISSRDIRRRFDVDLTRYYTNDPTEMQKYYGLYISMYTIINEFTNIILAISSSTNVSHILMLFSNLFQTGRLTGVISSGATERGMSVLARSSLEKGGDIIATAARSGVRELTKDSATSSLHVGRKIASGTGAVDVHTMHNRMDLIREEMSARNRDFVQNRKEIPDKIVVEEIKTKVDLTSIIEPDLLDYDSDEDDFIVDVPIQVPPSIPIPAEISDEDINDLIRFIEEN